MAGFTIFFVIKRAGGARITSSRRCSAASRSFGRTENATKRSGLIFFTFVVLTRESLQTFEFSFLKRLNLNFFSYDFEETL